MLKELKRHLTMYKTETIWQFAMVLAVPLLINIVAFIVYSVSGVGTTFTHLGAYTMIGVTCMFTLVLCINRTGVQFNLALKMGAVRRLYFAANFLLMWASCFVLLMLCNLMALAETAVFGLIGVTLSPNWLLSPLLGAGLAVVVVVLGSWGGALIMRYGKGGFWVMWALWMLPTIGGSQISAALRATRTDPFARVVQAIAAFLAKFPALGLWAVALVLLVALAVHAWALQRKAAVTN